MWYIEGLFVNFVFWPKEKKVFWRWSRDIYKFGQANRRAQERPVEYKGKREKSKAQDTESLLVYEEVSTVKCERLSLSHGKKKKSVCDFCISSCHCLVQLLLLVGLNHALMQIVWQIIISLPRFIRVRTWKRNQILL